MKTNVGKVTHGCSLPSADGYKTYIVWNSMLKRCRNTADKDYPRYGGRGIRVYEPWFKFENFLADVGPRPSLSHSIDRFPDNDGDYEPGNVRWATVTEQANNRRSSRPIEFQGKRLTIAQWARELGIRNQTLQARLAKWSIERALTSALSAKHSVIAKVGRAGAPMPEESA